MRDESELRFAQLIIHNSSFITSKWFIHFSKRYWNTSLVNVVRATRPAPVWCVDRRGLSLSKPGSAFDKLRLHLH